MTNSELILEAKKAREHAYAPYSDFMVGAALLTKSGKLYHGCNIENSSFSPTNCAERTAFFKAVYDGERDFDKIAIVGGPRGTEADEMCTPCGVCRQVMAEFCDLEEFRIILADGKEKHIEVRLKDMMPYTFNYKQGK